MAEVRGGWVIVRGGDKAVARIIDGGALLNLGD